jgi:integrase-like protein
VQTELCKAPIVSRQFIIVDIADWNLGRLRLSIRIREHLLHDRDTKYTQSFRAIIASGQVEPLVLPARSPNLNAYAECWVRSVKEECLSKVVLLGERSLRRALAEYVEHYHAERNHQGKGNVLLFPRGMNIRRDGPVQCRERLGCRKRARARSCAGCWHRFRAVKTLAT